MFANTARLILPSAKLIASTRAGIVAGLVLVTLCCVNSVTAQNSTNLENLERLSQEQKDAETLHKNLSEQQKEARKEIERLRNDLVKSAAQAASHEQAARNIVQRLSELETEHETLSKDIFEDHSALSDLLGALQRIERNPPPALAVNPQDAKAAAQAARLLTTISISLKERADLLSERLSNLGFVKDSILSEKLALEERETELAMRRSAIKKVVSKKQSLESSISLQTATQERRIERLASESANLRDLISKFEARARSVQPRIKPENEAQSASSHPNRQSGIPVPHIKPRADTPPEPLVLPPDTKRFADARGSLRAPARGEVITRYNAKQKDGTRAKGLTVRTRGEAQVLAPYSGRIEFVGPFKNYDRVIILNVGESYFILMTGLGETYGKEGQTVTAGEPVGLMPFNASKEPELYIEIRKNGSTIDPTPWLGTAFARNG